MSWSPPRSRSFCLLPDELRASDNKSPTFLSDFPSGQHDATPAFGCTFDGLNNAMHFDRVLEAWRGTSAVPQILGHSGVETCDIPSLHVLRPAGAVSGGNLQCTELRLSLACTHEGKPHHLRMTRGA